MYVPGDKVGPWDVETRIGLRTDKAKEHDCGSSGGEDEVADSQFKQAKRLQNQAYAEVCKGTAAGVLAGLVLTDEEKKQQAEQSGTRDRMRKLRTKKVKFGSPGRRAPKSLFRLPRHSIPYFTFARPAVKSLCTYMRHVSFHTSSIPYDS